MVTQWKLLVSCNHQFEFSMHSLLGIYPDMLHILDVQITHDVILSSLLELSDPPASNSRGERLQELCRSYQQWCQEQRAIAQRDKVKFLLGKVYKI